MDDLERLLSSEEPLTPSSGFAARVMGAIHESGTRVAPLPFPWGRVAAGAVASGVCAAAGVLVLRDALSAATVPQQLIGAAPSLGMAAAAVVLSLAPIYGRRLFRE